VSSAVAGEVPKVVATDAVATEVARMVENSVEGVIVGNVIVGFRRAVPGAIAAGLKRKAPKGRGVSPPSAVSVKRTERAESDEVGAQSHGSIAQAGAARGIVRRVFTGLVQSLGHIAEIRPAATSTRLIVDAGSWAHQPDLGASISVNGCCLTVVAVDGGQFAFDVIPQTLRVTSLGALAVGSGVNLEHAATPMTFLGGHVVLGHVDALGEVVAIETEHEWRVRVRLPASLARFVVEKGSIALDGVSLTIARVDDGAAHANDGTIIDGTIIDVCLIPETLARTNLAERRVGDTINVEVDHLAKLVARQLEWMQAREAR